MQWFDDVPSPLRDSLLRRVEIMAGSALDAPARPAESCDGEADLVCSSLDLTEELTGSTAQPVACGLTGCAVGAVPLQVLQRNNHHHITNTIINSIDVQYFYCNSSN